MSRSIALALPKRLLPPLAVLALAAAALAPALFRSAASAESMTVTPNGPYQEGAIAAVIQGGGLASLAAAQIETDSGRPVLAIWLLTGGQWQYYLSQFPSRSTLNFFDPLVSVFAVLGPTAGSAPPPPPPPPAGSPTTSGQAEIGFASYHREPDEFRGTVTEIRRMATIPASGILGTASAPAGHEYALIYMTVTNISNKPKYVATLSIRIRDAQGRIFTLDFPNDTRVQGTAQEYAKRPGWLDPLQPGVPTETVFAFLVPTDATGLIVERYPP